MKYMLRIHALGEFPEMELAPEYFAELRSARGVLSAAFEMEELYDILISTYRKLEELLVTTSVTHMIEDRYEHHEFYLGRLNFNVAIVALLTSARLYIDRIGSSTQRATPKSPEVAEAISAIRSKHYDSCTSYRFLEAFRNHVQHAGLPVGLTTFGSRRTKESDYQLMEHSVGLFVSKSALLKNKKFKAVAVADLPERINIVEAVRAYIEALSDVHSQCRVMVGQEVSLSRSVILKAIEQYRLLWTGSQVGLAAIAMEAEKVVEKLPLLLKWDDVRIRLQEKNPELKGLTKRYVSSQIRSSRMTAPQARIRG